MKINIMGTAAYERVPAMFCRCKVCEMARSVGGKNMRTQAQVLIDDVLLVDFGQDNYLHFLKSNKDYTKIKSILITHAHSDHFMENELMMTYGAYGHNDIKEKIKVFGNEECGEKFSHNTEPTKCDYNTVKPYQTFKTHKYSITPLPANHSTNNPLCYIINDGQNTLLYNNDSGIFSEEVYSFIEKNNYKFDAVIADCTCGLLHLTGGTHMSLIDNEMHRERLSKIGAVGLDTAWVITHYSHNGLFENDEPVTAERMQEIATEKNMISAYDGMEIEI